MRFPSLAARLALAALVLAILIAGAAILSVRMDLAGFTAGQEMMTSAVAFGAIALILAMSWASAALRHNRGDGKRAGMIALVGAALLLYFPLRTVYQGLMAPPIHDVTTDPDDPPQFVALAKDGAHFDGKAVIDYRGEHNTVSYMLHEYYSGLTKPLMPLMPHGNPTAKMFWRAFNRAKDMGWHIVDFNEKEGRIEAQATSFWFGRVSDIVIRVKPAGTLGARFDVRAASRDGEHDFGRDLELIKTYRASLSS